MKTRKANLIIVENCGSALLDDILRSEKYIASSLNGILIHSDDITNNHLKNIIDNADCIVSKNYYGYILLQ